MINPPGRDNGRRFRLSHTEVKGLPVGAASCRDQAPVGAAFCRERLLILPRTITGGSGILPRTIVGGSGILPRTIADFAANDRRWERHFAAIERWGSMRRCTSRLEAAPTRPARRGWKPLPPVRYVAAGSRSHRSGTSRLEAAPTGPARTGDTALQCHPCVERSALRVSALATSDDWQGDHSVISSRSCHRKGQVGAML